MPVVMVRGNHDHLDEHDLWPRLRTLHPVSTHERSGLDIIAGVAVGVMPWPRKANAEAAGVDAREAMRATLRGLGYMMAEHDGPRVLLTHAMVRGSRTSTGQELLGCELELGLEDLALARADLYALGHIHAHQGWDIAGAPAIYPGSPRRANFGELEPKGYVVAEFDGRQLVGWEFVDVPATPMVHLDATWNPDSASLDGLDDADCPEGAEIRLRFRVPSDHREAARRYAQRWAEEFRAAGAASVKVEEQVLATTRARSPEVARAVTLVDKLDALWSARRDVPDPVRRDALVAKLGELESSAGT
jgi:exonuclease SbcD